MQTARRQLTLTAALVGASVLAFAPAWFDSVGRGVVLVGGERVLGGDLPYRDFWTMYAPGQFYLMALLFRVFGLHAAVSAVGASLLAALSIGVVHRLLLRVTTSARYAFIGAALCLAVLLAEPQYRGLSGYVPALLAILLSLWLLVRHLESSSTLALVGCGLSLGVTALFKHDVAAYTAVAVACGLLVRPRPAGATWTRSLRDIGIVAAAAAAPVLPVAGVFAVLAGPDVLQDLFVFPATAFRHTRPESYPSLLPIGLAASEVSTSAINVGRYLYFAVLPVVFLVGTVAVLSTLRRRDPVRGPLGVTCAVGWLFHYAAAHVQVNTHVVSMSFHTVVLGVLALDRARCAGDRTVAWRRAGAAIALVWLAALLVRPAYDAYSSADRRAQPLDLPRAAGIALPQRQTERMACLAAAVDRHASGGEPIWVGKLRHDLVIRDESNLYFLLARPSATRYHELHPGVVDTAAVQREIISDLEGREVGVLVLREVANPELLERAKRRMQTHVPAIGATDLDTWIRANYEPVDHCTPYQVWSRRGRSGPPSGAAGQSGLSSSGSSAM
jgi:hypothetical protein